MTLSRRRIGAIYRKDQREFRRNKQIIAAVIFLPVVFILPPLIDVLSIPSGVVGPRLGHVLLYLLAVPIMLPAQIAAFTVVGERQQGTLEPVLGTPVQPAEFLIGKALALFAPSLAASYGVYGVMIAMIELFAHPGVAPAFVQAPNVLAQVVFSPLLVAWSIWAGVTISSRCADSRVAQQLSLLGTLPLMAVAVLMAYDVIGSSLLIGVICGAVLLAMDAFGWRIASLAFDRERIITARGIRRRWSVLRG